MSKKKYISEFEKSCIRIGKSRGINNATIARALKRSPQVIGHHVNQMTIDGTICELPLILFVEEIGEMIEREGAKK